ncbi:ABC transporter transmembrane domain-containing protein [Zunongwangia sp. H14]|uniref:ABC transporter transmembrane domain-containing protein n=1 Tax=Zunongwangia sp. H14 TaxID=3240792 RepID=UPI0035630E80
MTLIFPFLTQALIDEGIGNQSLRIVYIILLAQIFLFLGNSVIEIIRNWITLYIGARINISIISDFLRKLMKLPIKFFDAKMIGDFTQRIADHERIEAFLTSQSLFTLFSLINVSVFYRLSLLRFNDSNGVFDFYNFGNNMGVIFSK